VSEAGGRTFGDPWGTQTSTTNDGDAAGGPNEQYVELIGTHLRASGVLDLGRFRRITDYVNLLDGFLPIRDVVLLTRTGETTRITMPELRVRLDDVALVGQLAVQPMPRATDLGVHVEKLAHRLVIMTKAHIVYGYVHIHEHASLMAFVDSMDPRFIPMSNVRVRWLADRRLAARYPFAVLQRSLILGVATEGTGAPRSARARRRAAIAEVEAAEASAEAGAEAASADPVTE
jgi:hypothetical protein